jgi:hypothetical protein
MFTIDWDSRTRSGEDDAGTAHNWARSRTAPRLRGTSGRVHTVQYLGSGLVVWIKAPSGTIVLLLLLHPVRGTHYAS